MRQNGKLFFAAGDRTISVGCVPSYAHLGGRITAKGSAMADLRQKVATALAAARPLAKSVLRNEHLPLPKRRQLLFGLALSRVTHTAPTWPRLGVGETAAWTTGYAKLVRLMTRDDRWTGEPSLPGAVELCKATGMPLPISFLRCERMHHFARCVVHQQETLLALLEAERRASPAGSWLEQLRQDVEWLGAQLEAPAALLRTFPRGCRPSCSSARSVFMEWSAKPPAWSLSRQRPGRWQLRRMLLRTPARCVGTPSQPTKPSGHTDSPCTT